MARTAGFGFDSSDYVIEAINNPLPAGVTFDSTTPDGVGKSLKFVVPSGSSAVSIAQTVGSSPEWRGARFRFDSVPGVDPRIIVGSSVGMNLRIMPDGTIGFYSAGSNLANSSFIYTPTQWFTLEWVSNSSASSMVRMRINGVDEFTTTANSTFALVLGSTDTGSGGFTMYIDDYKADNAAFPFRTGDGAGAMRLLLPISDNARAALWVAGSNATTATTNLWDAVNNTPPVGTATSNAVTAAISHEGSAAGTTDDYDANMTSYSSAGIAAGSTIHAVRAMISHAEDIATGAKLLTFSIKSNPAQGAFETNFTAGNTVAAGTYPTNWVLTRGTQINSPSVTLGTSPVMSVRRPETASRRADVCFMGIYVDFTPPVPAAFIARKPMTVLRAVPRASSW